MTENSSTFRGIAGIREIKAKALPLIAWYQKFRPDVRDFYLSRKDYDLIARWPKASRFEGFDITDNGIFYEGLRMTYDAGEGRYVKPLEPEQARIE